jgi:uncharacterized protein YecT (DUF1311 family)
MKIFFAVIIILLSSSAPSQTQESEKSQTPSQASSNPCDRVNTQTEMNQCTGDEYRKADAHLNAVYQKLLASLKKNVADAQKANDAQRKGNVEDALQNLKAAEKAWLVYREGHCAAAKQQYEGGSISPMVYANCMQLVTNHRIEELKAAYETPDRKLE